MKLFEKAKIKEDALWTLTYMYIYICIYIYMYIFIFVFVFTLDTYSMKVLEPQFE